LPIHQSFIRQKVVRSQLNRECVLSIAKVFSANFLAVPTLPKFSPAKVLYYTVNISCFHAGMKCQQIRSTGTQLTMAVYKRDWLARLYIMCFLRGFLSIPILNPSYFIKILYILYSMQNNCAHLTLYIIVIFSDVTIKILASSIIACL